MSGDDHTTAELVELHAQLQRLRDEREIPQEHAGEQPAAPPESPADSEREVLAWLGVGPDLEASEVLEGLRRSVGGWLAEMDEDLKNTRPSTILAIFAMGVLVGKFSK